MIKKVITQNDIEEKLKKIDYYPTLGQLVREFNDEYSTKEIKKIIDILLEENHILINKGQIVLIWNPELTAYLEKHGVKIL